MSAHQVEVLLPVHNEGESIESTIRGMNTELSRVTNIGFIVCEDGSRDNSKEVLRSLATELPIRLNLSDARKGYSKAMREGMEMCESEYLLCLDSDGQCDPRDFQKFWDARNSADVIIGWRVHRADPLVRRIFSRFFFLLYQAVFHAPVHDPSCPYVLMRDSVAKVMAKELGEMKEGFWWEFVARSHRHGFTLYEIPIKHQQRAAGVTQVYKWSKMPGIFFRHVAAIFKIWSQTRHAKKCRQPPSPAPSAPAKPDLQQSSCPIRAAGSAAWVGSMMKIICRAPLSKTPRPPARQSIFWIQE